MHIYIHAVWGKKSYVHACLCYLVFYFYSQHGILHGWSLQMHGTLTTGGAKYFISRLQFLDKVKKHGDKCCSQWIFMCICAACVQYMCTLGCKKHASSNMGKVQWSKLSVDKNIEMLFTLVELCSLRPVLILALELNPPKSQINREKENKSWPTCNSIFFMLKAFHSLFPPLYNTALMSVTHLDVNQNGCAKSLVKENVFKTLFPWQGRT